MMQKREKTVKKKVGGGQRASEELSNVAYLVITNEKKTGIHLNL